MVAADAIHADPDTPCVCTHAARMHETEHYGCNGMIRIGGLVLEEGDGLKPGVKMTPCPCGRFVEEK